MPEGFWERIDRKISDERKQARALRRGASQILLEEEINQPPEGIEIQSWLNVPRYGGPGFRDRWGVARGPILVGREEYRKKLRNVFDFSWPATFWFLGKRFVGKSTGAERIAIAYLKCKNKYSLGGTVIDLFSSDDDEGAAWARAGFYPILLIFGNKVDPQFKEGGFAKKLHDQKKLDWIHIGDLKFNTPEQLEESLRKLESYKVVITVPSFYFNPHEMFTALSDLIDLLRLRGKTTWTIKGKRKIFCLIVREAKVLLASRFWSGAVHSRQDAEMDLIAMNDGAYHTGIALSFDSLRFTSITPEVRDIAEFTFVKRLGRMKIPRELHYILRYVTPRFLRRMPKASFVLYTDTDDIYQGSNEAVSWHVKRGEGPLNQLGIKPIYNAEALRPSPAQTVIGETVSEVQNLKWKVGIEVHKAIVKMIETEGLSYAKAQKKLELPRKEGGMEIHLSVATLHAEVKAHREELCLCTTSSSGGLLPQDPGESEE